MRSRTSIRDPSGSHKRFNNRMLLKYWIDRVRFRPLLLIFFVFITLSVYFLFRLPSRISSKPLPSNRFASYPLSKGQLSSPSLSLTISQNPLAVLPDVNAAPNIAAPDHSFIFDVVILASGTNASDEVHKTVMSISAISPSANVRVLHFAQAPDAQLSHYVHDYTLHHSRRPYDNPLRAPNMYNPSTLLVVAGTYLSAHALDWLAAAQESYGNRTDVAAFALDSIVPLRKRDASALDHKQSSWTPLKLPETSAFIYRACPQASAFVLNLTPKDFDPWTVFSEWLTLRRSDWYHYASGPGVDGTPFGMSALPERNWTRAPWNVWFSKFLHEYQLGVVYPNVRGALALNERLSRNGPFASDQAIYAGSKSWMLDRDIPVLLGDGWLPDKNYFSDATLGKIVEVGQRQGGVISFTMVNNVFIETSRSWLCNVDVGGFRPKGLLWAVTDSESLNEFSTIDGSTTVRLNEVQGGKSTGHHFGNPGYWKLMLERTALITEILARGVAVFAFETDAIWLEDPSSYIDELVGQDADIVGTINTRTEVSGNFFYLRPTLATRRLWYEITTEFTKAYNRAHFEKKEPSSWTYIENDQSLLTKLILRNETWRKAYPLTFLTLDMEKFVDGRWYTPEKGFYTSNRARNPVVINNNFVVGVAEKMDRAKKFGHWFWDERNNKCLDDAVMKVVH